jgi:hypothetical protein
MTCPCRETPDVKREAAVARPQWGAWNGVANFRLLMNLMNVRASVAVNSQRWVRLPKAPAQPFGSQSLDAKRMDKVRA